jgi:RHS repeat-associated protein
VKRPNIGELLVKWKPKHTKLAKNRKSHFEQLEARQMLAAAVWTNVLQPLDVTQDADARISPLDALLIINELNLRVYSPQFKPLPLEIPDGSVPPPFVDTSCDGYVSPIDALLVINRLNAKDVPAGTTSSSGKPTWHFSNSGGSSGGSGKYVFDACSPRLIEGDSFSTQLSASVFIPDSTTAVKVKFDAPSFDITSQRSIRDALEFLVLDQAGQPLVLPYAPGRDAAFNWSEGLDSLPGVAVQYVTGSATLNLAGIAASGSTVQVIARLANNDQDNNSAVTIRGIEVIDSQTAAPTSYQPTGRTNAINPFDFASLADVSGSLQVVYGDTALSEDDASSISSNVQVLNSGSYPIVGTLIAVLSNLSDPAVGLMNPDGFTADGRPYLNLTSQMGESLAPGATTSPRLIQFTNASRERFSYSFTMLSGLNKVPVVSQLADILIGVGDALVTQIKAVDPEQQPLTYSLIAKPQGMTIKADTGFISWTPAAHEVGSTQVRFKVSDSLGGMTEQSFTIDVRAAIANRPPIITSTPETDAVVSSPFEVQTYATGLGPVAIDVLVQTNGTSSIVTANEGDQQLGYLAGEPRRFDASQPVSIGEPHPSGLSTPFSIGYPVELGLAPNTIGNFQRNIQGVLSEDVNHDGNPDLIVLANRSASGNWNDPNDVGHVIVRLGNGDGSFREGWSARLPVVTGRIGRAASAHVMDVTGDGRYDLVITTIATNQTLVYPGHTTNLFDATPIVSANPGNYVTNTQLADLNADGKLDLVLFENEQVQIGGRRGIGIQLGDGTGRFSGTTLVPALNNNGGLGYVADVDGVNGPDLVRLNYVDTRIEVRLNNGSGEFGDDIHSLTQTYFTGANTGARNIHPTSAYIDDFDGDGKADALFSGPLGIVLLKGQGNGRFGDGTQSGNAIVAVDHFDDPRWPGIANSDGRGNDLNGDGKLDFVFGNTANAGNIMVGLGNGRGGFALRQYNASFRRDIGQGIDRASPTLQYIAIADFNRDGVLDMAGGASELGQQPGAVGIFLGDLPGTLRSPVFVNDYSYAADYSLVKGRSGESATGDFNGDGFIDIVTMGGAGFGSAFYFAAGNGDGTFAPYQAALGGIQSDNSLTALDIDRDGILDLAWMDGGRFGQAFGLGNGAFQYLPLISSQGAGQAGVSKQIIQSDDFNRDGYPDLVYRLQTGHIDSNFNTKIVVLIYDPANRRYRELADATNLITFTPRAYGFYHDEALGMGDLNNDGVKEFFAFSRNNPNNGTPARLAIYEQSGNTGNDASELFRKTVLENPTFIPADTAIYSYVVDDFNLDGNNDIAYSTNSATAVVMFGNGDFTFRDATTYLTNGFLLNRGDFNGDGLTDLATTWGYGFISYSQRPFNGVLLGRSDGTFSEHYSYTTATTQTNGLFVGDFNGDGTDDLTGLGGFRHNEAFIGRTLGLADIATGDVNGDGRPDAVTVVAGLDRVKVLHGVVDETYARQPDLFTDLFPVAVELVHADDDDLLDILAANQVGKSLSLFKHTSPTTYSRTDIDLPVRPSDLVVGDFNDDGKTDAVAISSLDETLVGLLAGNDTFGTTLVLPLGFSPSGVASGDVSGDGKLDIVLSDSVGDRLIVLQGRGDGTFLAPFVIPAVHAPGSLGIADLNADGRSDIVAAQPEDDRIALFFNRGSGRFTTPQFIQVGEKPVAVQIRDVNGDNKPDILVPNQAENTVSVILNRFDPNEVWTYKPTATDPDGDVVTFDLTNAPGGMLYDSASNTVYWAPMPEQIGSNSVVLTASDGNGGSTDQGFVVTVTAPVSVLPPIFTSTPVTTFGADSVYRYEPNVQAEEDGPKRFSLVEGPTGMTIDPTTGAVEWDGRSKGIKLFANFSSPGNPVSNQNTGQIQIPDSLSLRSASVTAEGWFNFEDPRGALWDQLLSKQLSNGNSATPSWGLEYYYGTLRAHVGKPGQSASLATVTSPAPIEFNKWVHIAMTFDDNTKLLTLYVNGKSVGSKISPESIGYNELPLVSGSNYITLSRVKVWNTARSASEIAAQALSAVPSTTPGLIVDLKFHESKVVSTILDASNSKNDGRLIGTPDFVNFPNRVPALASEGSYPVTIRVEDGKGGVTQQSFVVSVKAPTSTKVTGIVFDDVNGNGMWDRRPGENLVFNGDFGSGPVGYETDFIQRENQSSLGWLGDPHSTVSNSTGAFANTPFYTAHTNGATTDLMLLANGDTQDRVAWRQSIATTSGQSYDLSFWAIRANGYEAPRLAVRVNGQSLGAVLALSDMGLNQWKRFLGTFQANSSTTLVEILLLGSTTAINPGLSGAENVAGIDDILFVPSSSTRRIVSGKANPYLAGMPDGTTAFGGTAPLASPPFVTVSTGQQLRFVATGHTTTEGFIVSRSADGIVSSAAGLVTHSVLNGISQFSSPRHGSLIGVFLDDSSPAGQTAPTALDFRASGNVPGGIDYTALQPALRQVFFIGDGRTADGVEQTITVPAGATRLFFANASRDSANSNTGEFEVQIFDSVSEPVQPNRQVFVDSNFNGRLDDTEPSTLTNARGVYALPIPGTTGQLGLFGKEGELQTAPTIPYRTFDIQSDVLPINFGSRDFALTDSPLFTTQPVTAAIAPGAYRYQSFAQSPTGKPMTYALAVGPQGMSIDPTSGLVRWNPIASNRGDNEVILKATDAEGKLALQRYTIKVEVNTIPIVTSASPTRAFQGIPFEYHVLAQDAEQSDLRYSLTSAPVGMTIDADTGLIRWLPSTLESTNATVAIVDQKGGAAVHNFSLLVQVPGTNRAPQLASVQQTKAVLGREFASRIDATDEDNDVLTYSLVSGPSGLTVSSGGEIFWQPSLTGSFDFVARVTDNRGGADEQTYTLNVVSRAPAPDLQITSSPTTAAVVGQLFAYDVVAENGELFELVTSPTGMSIAPARGTIRWVPTNDQLGVQTIKVLVSDVLGNTAEQSFVVAVRSSSLVPTISSAPLTEAAVGQTYVYSISVSNPSKSPLTYSLTVSPSGMQIDAALGVINWTPNPGQLGPSVISIHVRDAVGNFSSQTFSVVVSAGAINRPPVAVSTPSIDAVVGQPYVYTMVASDPEGAAVTYAVRSGPSGFSIAPSTGVVTWTPTATDIGTVALVLTATDPQGGVAVQSIQIDVRAANRLPTIGSNPNLKVSQGAVYQYDVIATDLDREPLFYSLVTAPAGMTIDALGRIRWQTQLNTSLGGRDVVVRVVDGLGGAVAQSYTFGVVADTLAPRITIFVSGEPVLYPWTTSPAIVRVIAADDVGLTGVELKVDGQSVELAADGTARVYFSAPGNGRLQALATDAAGNQGTAIARVSMRSGEEDGGGNPAPEATITSITDGVAVGGFVDVIGTAAAPDFQSYSLSYRRVDESTYKTILSSTTPVTGRSLGKWDTTLLENDSYILKLEVIDTFGSFAAVEVEVSVSSNLKLGNFRLSFEDMTIPVAGIPISITRTYDTLRADSDGDFGYGWRLEYRNTDLRTNLPKSGLEDIGIFTPFKPGTKVFLTLPGGQREGFTFTPDIKVLPGFGRDNNLVLASPRFTPDRGVTSKLSAGSGQLVVNEFGELYSAGGVPWNPASPDFTGYVVTTLEGIQYGIAGDTGLMTSATDRNGNRITFTATGIQSSSGHEIRFERDSRGRLRKITDLLGRSYQYHYDSVGNLAQVKDREGNSTQFSYLNLPEHYLSNVVDPLGRTGLRTEYGPDGRLIRTINSLGEAVTVTYDPSNSLVYSRDPLGNESIVEYDSLGNVVATTDALGNKSRMTYDENNYLLTVTDALGRVAANKVDAHGNIIAVKDPLGNEGHSTYDSFGNLLSHTDPLGNSTRSEYDQKGNLIRQIDPLGNVTSSTVDKAGNVTSARLPGGFTVLMVGGSAPSELVESNGARTSVTYDAMIQPVTRSTQVSTPNGITTLIERVKYDAQGRVIESVDKGGSITNTEYDFAGNVTAVVDSLGRRSTVNYDSLGRPVFIGFSDGTSESTTYDAAGRVSSTTDRAGRVNRFEYDRVGQLTMVILPDATPGDNSDNPRYRSEFDAAGQVIAQIDPLGRRTSYEYDGAGRKTLTRTATGEVYRAEYDSAGRQTSSIDSLGRVTKFQYDAAGRLTVEVAPDGSRVQSIFNSAGQLERRIDFAGLETAFQYTSKGQLLSVTDPLGNRTEYSYDELGRRVAMMDGLGRVTKYEFDAVGRQTAIQLTTGERAESTYDELGRLVNERDFDGRVTTYRYDSSDRSVVRSRSDGTSIRTTYTATGRPATVTDASGVAVYEYDALDRIVSRTGPHVGNVRYVYDLAGNQTEIITEAGSTQMSYDASNRLIAVRSVAGETHYKYDVAGRVIRTQFPNGTEETRRYDVNDRLLSQETLVTSSSHIIASFTYTYDATGRRTSVEEANGRKTAYSYDANSRLIGETVTEANQTLRETRYSYDAVGNRTSRVDSSSGTTTYVYDDRYQLITELTGLNRITREYDKNGNLTVQEGGPNDRSVYTWDANGRLVAASVTDSSGTKLVSYQYDADGNMIARIEDGVETRFVVDVSRQNPTVLTETRANHVTSFAYGDGRISQSSDEGTFYFVADAIGTVRMMTSSSGNVVGEYEYSAFGEVLSHSGDATSDFLFTGERRDSATGLDYLRARNYDTGTGRFVSRDPFPGTSTVPATFNPYSYAHNDPISLSDPSGQTVMEQLTTLAIQGQLLAQRLFVIKKATDAVSFLRELYFWVSAASVFNHFLIDYTAGVYKAGAIKASSNIIKLESEGTFFREFKVDLGVSKGDDVLSLGLTAGKKDSSTSGKVGSNLNLSKIQRGQIEQAGLDFLLGFSGGLNYNLLPKLPKNTLKLEIYGRVGFSAWETHGHSNSVVSGVSGGFEVTIGPTFKLTLELVPGLPLALLGYKKTALINV